MKNSSLIAAIWGVSAFATNRIAAGRQRPAANGNGGADRKTGIIFAAAINASGSGGGGKPIPTTGAANDLLPQVRYKTPPLRYKRSVLRSQP